MNNWFVYLSVFEELYDKVIEEIHNSNKLFEKPVGFLYSKGQAKRVNEGNYSQLDIYSSLVAQALTHEPDLEFIKELEQEYAITNISLAVFADRHFGHNNNYTYKQKLALIELTFKYAINLYATYGFKFAWFESIGGFASYIFYLVFKKKGVKICVIAFDQFPGKIAICENEKLIWNGVVKEIVNLSGASVPSEQETIKAKNFLKEYRLNLPVPSSFSKEKLPTRIKPRDFSLFKKWTKDYFAGQDYMRVSPIKLLFSKLRRIYRTWYSRFIFDNEELSEIGDYVFFPLHFQPEMTTLVCAPHCLNQVSVIEDLAKSLPAGVRLVVKEHHGSIGRRSLKDYKQIKQNWNVLLLGPEVNTMEFIKEAKVVTTINSTVGLQGLLLGKPVITLARVGYDACSQIIRGHLTPKEEYSKLILEAIDAKINEEEIVKFCVAVERGLIDAEEGFNLEHPGYDKKSLTPANIRLVAQVIKDDFMNHIQRNALD